MTAVDPTYPLYPVACLGSAAMLLLVLLTSFMRQNWNLGVTLLCVWMFFENLTFGINAILWADNVDIKLYVYCDIISRLQACSGFVKPMATLIITRRLYLIANQRSVGLFDYKARRKNLIIEWTLGLVIPILVAGPVYYVVQMKRFQVDEGFGCINAPDISVLGILLFWSWSTIPPLLSVCIYYPRVARVFYRHHRDVNRFLDSNDSAVSRSHYMRILVLASIDVLLTLPIGIVTIALIVVDSLSEGSLPFYSGWTKVHTDWEPIGYPYSELKALGTPNIAQPYFVHWTSPVLAFAIFGLFGITTEARASYLNIASSIGSWLGGKSTARGRQTRATLGMLEFSERPLDAENGLGTPTSMTFDARAGAQSSASGG